MTALAPVPTIDDIEAHTHNLVQLLDTLVENLMNVNYPADVGALTRVGALSIIARDMGEKALADITACNNAKFAQRCSAKPGAAA
jgi:hypothetical protein